MKITTANKRTTITQSNSVTLIAIIAWLFQSFVPIGNCVEDIVKVGAKIGAELVGM